MVMSTVSTIYNLDLLYLALSLPSYLRAAGEPATLSTQSFVPTRLIVAYACVPALPK